MTGVSGQKMDNKFKLAGDSLGLKQIRRLLEKFTGELKSSGKPLHILAQNNENS